MSPLLFLLVGEGLSRAIIEENRRGMFKGITITQNLRITNILIDILLVDGVLISNVSWGDVEKL